jgi:hypothetical protein
MKKKILTVNIFIVFILILPVSNAYNVCMDVESESRDNLIDKSLDDYKEIITLIDGTCDNVTTKGIYIKRDVVFQAGDDTELEISGFYRPWNYFNEVDVIYIYAPVYFGAIFSHPGGTTYSIWGFAIGDIEYY